MDLFQCWGLCELWGLRNGDDTAGEGIGRPGSRGHQTCLMKGSRGQVEWTWDIGAKTPGGPWVPLTWLLTLSPVGCKPPSHSLYSAQGLWFEPCETSDTWLFFYFENRVSYNLSLLVKSLLVGSGQRRRDGGGTDKTERFNRDPRPTLIWPGVQKMPSVL